eukprot:1485220-Rhodomonas_salina.1
MPPQKESIKDFEVLSKRERETRSFAEVVQQGAAAQKRDTVEEVEKPNGVEVNKEKRTDDAEPEPFVAGEGDTPEALDEAGWKSRQDKGQGAAGGEEGGLSSEDGHVLMEKLKQAILKKSEKETPGLMDKRIFDALAKEPPLQLTFSDDVWQTFVQETIDSDYATNVTLIVHNARKKAEQEKDKKGFSLKNNVWLPLLKTLYDHEKGARIRPFDDNPQFLHFYNQIPAELKGDLKPVGSLLDESIIAAAVIRYVVFDGSDGGERKMNSVLYYALKNHLKLYHRATYVEIQNILKLGGDAFFDHLKKAPIRALIEEMKNIVVQMISANPSDISQSIVMAAKKKLSTFTDLFQSMFLISSTVIILGIIAIVELMHEDADISTIAQHRSELDSTIDYMMHDLDGLVRKSSYRISTVTSLFSRIFEMVGVDRTAMLMERLPDFADVQSNLASVATLAAMEEVKAV